MASVKTFIDSGILEMYVLGLTGAEENEGIVRMATSHAAVQKEIDSISFLLYQYILENIVQPGPSVRHSVINAIKHLR